MEPSREEKERRRSECRRMEREMRLTVNMDLALRGASHGVPVRAALAVTLDITFSVARMDQQL